MLNTTKKTQKIYKDFKKPFFAPPAWLFAPVWTFLYILIFISFGRVFLSFVEGQFGFLIILPFILNLIFNFTFTFFEFKLRNYFLASVDVILTWITIIWCMVIIYQIFPWVTYFQIPYLLWVSFASILQLNVTYLNRK